MQWKQDPGGQWHWVGQPYLQSSGGSAWNLKKDARVWTCTNCKSNNHSPKTCATCGLKRTYAQVAGSPPRADTSSATPAPWAQPSPSGGAPVRQQLEQLTAKLTAVTNENTEPFSRAAAPAAPVLPLLDKKEVVAQMKSLEAALAALPASEECIASSLQQRIAALKQQLGATKPLGARLDAARDALRRAHTRYQDAQAAEETARALAVATAADVAKVEADVSALESELARAPAEAPDLVVKDPWPATQDHLNSLVDLLRADPHIPPALAEEAGQHVARLLQGFSGALQHASQARAAAAAVESPLRMKGKQPPPPAKPGVLIRAVGKQPEKRLITEYFSGKKKVMKTSS